MRLGAKKLLVKFDPGFFSFCGGLRLPSSIPAFVTLCTVVWQAKDLFILFDSWVELVRLLQRCLSQSFHSLSLHVLFVSDYGRFLRAFVACMKQFFFQLISFYFLIVSKQTVEYM